MLSALALGVLLAQATPVEEALLQCTAISKDKERLSCFDEAISALKQETEVRAAKQQEKAVEEFGVTVRAAEKELQELGDKVSEVRLDYNGRAIVTLENGQVWRQIQSSSRPILSVEIDRIETATIKRAALGSYRMTVEPLGRSFKVRRVDQD